jgi:Ser/Thr protein kinase RdoA (MazF antagonist)
MTAPFDQASYLAQVRRLRELAENAVSRFPIRVKALKFVNHGENTTFKAVAKDGRSYLLRIHRTGYHTTAGIQEELNWLSYLSKLSGVPVPKPIRSKGGRWIEAVPGPGLSAERDCCLFEWIDGRFISKSVKPSHLYKIGQVIAELQSLQPQHRARYRPRWDAEGLVGEKAKFGSIESLKGVRPEQHEILRQARRLVFAKLRKFERDFPKRQGLIHADLHFGNILAVGSDFGVIDFDDCGHGFHAYDLVIPLMSVESVLGEKNKGRLPEFKEALISGYTTQREWDAHDEKIFPHLIIARRLALLGWLGTRSDNPRLRKFFKGAVARALKRIRSEYGLAR